MYMFRTFLHLLLTLSILLSHLPRTFGAQGSFFEEDYPLKNLAQTVITAGLTHGVTQGLKMPAKPQGLEEIAKHQAVRSGVQMGTSMAFGAKPKEALVSGLKSFAVNMVLQYGSQQIGEAYQKNLLDDNNNNNPNNVIDHEPMESEVKPKPMSYIEHKLAHFGLGLVGGALYTLGDSKKNLLKNMITAGGAQVLAEVLSDVSYKTPAELYGEIAEDVRSSGKVLTQATYR